MLTKLESNNPTKTKPSLRTQYLRQFGRDEDGGIIVLTLLLLIIMLVMGGMAVDFMRYESKRAALQSCSDRAVLAAAELDQDLDSELVVTEYFESCGFPNAIKGTPIVNDQQGSRSVRVDSQLDINTFYLRLIGIDQLDAPASSAAIEGVGNTEISLVLDISGSMRSGVTGGGTRMSTLREAATDFVNTMLDPDVDGLVSMSLVSYSEHVSLGDELFDALNTTPDTMIANGTVLPDGTVAINNMMVDSGTYDLTLLDDDEYVTNPARCVDFEDAEFATTTFDADREYQQVERFEHYDDNSTIQLPLCPDQTHQGIFPLTSTASILTDEIAKFDHTSFTSIHLGMKWGVSLLDPSMRDVLAGVPTVDPLFRGVRPADYTSTTGVDTVKYVILMTDGVNVAGRRVKDSYYYDDEYAFFWRTTWNRYPHNYWRVSIRDHPEGRNTRPQMGTVSHTPNTATDANRQLQEICDAAKENDKIIVYTIAMGSGSTQMADCASNNGYYEDSGGEIQAIFEAIAKSITDLRLSL